MQSPQLTLQSIDLFQQVEGQGDSRQIDVEVALQTHGDARTLQIASGEPPAARISAFRLKDTLVNQVENPVGVHGTGPAKFGQAQGFFIVQPAAG
jgi:hypothetical protein